MSKRLPTPSFPINERLSKVEADAAGLKDSVAKMQKAFRDNDLLARVIALESQLVALKTELEG